MKRVLTLVLVCLSVLAFFTGCSLQPSQQPLAEAEGSLLVHYIDVGQGDCILIQTPSGKNMLIDAGNPGDFETIDAYLQSKGVKRLDAIMATHPHSDHIGAMAEVVKAYDVGEIYAPKVNHNTQTYKNFLKAAAAKGIAITPAHAGVTIDLDPAVGIELFSPVQDKSYSELNSYSPITKLTYGDRAFVFTGDAEMDAEADALAYGGARLKADVLKLGHHGSDTSSSQAFLQAVSPAYAVISVGQDNSYGHPAQTTLDHLQGVNIYRTDTMGTVTAVCDGTSLRFVTQRGSTGDNQIQPQATAAAGTSDQAASEALAQEAVYIGNKNSKKFHRPSCSGLPSEKNALSFSSREEAIAQGYTPCGICAP
ncbi:MAG: MBL fold metallo-hydrolase [Eubacterium sp.]|nr:MBL fold metallo-hydrolase [Eubacterium sp.]